MGILNLLGVKDTLGKVKGRLAEIEREIADVEKTRFDLVRKPLPLEDFIEWTCEQVDPIANLFPNVIKNSFLNRHGHLLRYMEDFPEGYDTTETFNSLYKIENQPIRILQTNANEWLPRDAFYYLFRDQIKAGIRSAMEEALKPIWPTKTGSKRSVRREALAKLDSAIEKLNEERHKIHDEIESLGVKF